jgi:hypothetical protein
MANMGPYLVEKYTKLIEVITNDLGNMSDRMTACQNIIRALKNPDTFVDGAPLTLSRIQIMENGDVRVLPPPPADTCVEETTKEFSKNGKREKETVPAL